MNSFERVKRCFAFEETDRPPVWDWIRNDAVIEHFTGQPLTVENGERLCMETYRTVTDATKQEIRFPQSTGIRHAPDGRKYIKQRWTEWLDADDIRFFQDNLAAAIQQIIKNYKGWDNNAQHELKVLLDDYKHKQDEAMPVMIFPCLGSVGLTEAYEFCGGIERFCYLLCDEPDLIHDYLELLCQKTLARLNHLPADFRPFAVFVGEDIAFKQGLLFPPDFLKQHFLPYLKKIIGAYHAIGAKVLFHSDGNLREIMDDLLEAGIDGINPIEETAGMTVPELRQKYPRLVLCGGVDVSHLLARGTPEDCYNKTMANINASPRGYMAGGSAEIHNGVQLNNYLAVLKAVGGPRKHLEP